MRVESVKIKNFRNFEDVEFDCTKNNIVIGLNDVGKSNLLYALRMVFDYQIRNKELIETDFFKKNISDPIEIIVKIDLSDDNVEENQKILAKIGSLNSVDKSEEKLIIKYIGIFEEHQALQWCVPYGDDLDYVDIPRAGLNQTTIDRIFKPMYIDSQMKFDATMKEFKRKALKEFGDDKFGDRADIDKSINDINESVAKLDEVVSIQSKIGTELKTLKADFEPIVRSNIAIEGLHNSLEVFTRYTDDKSEEIYPTAGDGKRKLVEYAMKNALINMDENIKYIPIIFIEEPENHLHLSIQLQLLDLISNFEHCFITTHSADILYSIKDNMNVIKLSRKEMKISAKSCVFQVPEEYKLIRHKFQKDLVSALFFEYIFLVEGYSEKLIWDRALDLHGKNKHSKFVLNIVGTNFKPYFDFLKNLGITIYVRTDNDLKRKSETTLELSGFNRLKKLTGDSIPYEDVEGRIKNVKESKDTDYFYRWNVAKLYYLVNGKILEDFRSKKLYLSEVDLENDIISVLREEESIEANYEDVALLQKAKWHNLINESIGREILSESGILKIINNSKFRGLKEFLDE